MSKLEDVEKAVASLAEADQARFREWYAEFDARVFDERLERDAKAGKLDKLAERAQAAHKAGETSAFG